METLKILDFKIGKKLPLCVSSKSFFLKSSLPPVRNQELFYYLNNTLETPGRRNTINKAGDIEIERCHTFSYDTC